VSTRLADYLAGATSRLSKTLDLDSRSARLEVRLLAAAALAVEPVWLITHDTDCLDLEQQTRLDALFTRRLNGEPIAYILGQREFYGRPFRVSPATLIPRPETEHLVEAALARAPAHARILDIGTGSGCIAITLKQERPDCTVVAIDLSPDALQVARDNAARLGAEVEFRQSDLFTALTDETFDIIVSNPPYIAEDDPHLDQGDLRHEPLTALASGSEGLDTLRAIVLHASAHLHDGGWLLLEHGWDQGEAVANLLAKAGYAKTFLEYDLAGQARISGGQRK
jgi:release factor glutamine methyltransferase